LRLLEPVLEVHEHRILAQRGRVGRDIRDDHHVSGVLHQDAGVAMIRVIVIRPRRQHEISVPLAYLTNDLQTHIEGRQQLAVVVVEDDILDADPPSRFLCLGAPPSGQRAAALRLMTGVAVGDGHESHAVAERGILGRRTAGALVAVVRMRPERDDVEFRFGARRLRRREVQHDRQQYSARCNCFHKRLNIMERR
jgi:hypothetical protein